MGNFYHTTTPRARKSYECIDCWETILVGERHVSASGVWEGEFFSQRSHAECEAIQNWLWRNCNHYEGRATFDCHIDFDGFEFFRRIYHALPEARERMTPWIISYVQERLDDEPGATAWWDKWLIVDFPNPTRAALASRLPHKPDGRE